MVEMSKASQILKTKSIVYDDKIWAHSNAPLSTLLRQQHSLLLRHQHQCYLVTGISGGSHLVEKSYFSTYYFDYVLKNQP